MQVFYLSTTSELYEGSAEACTVGVMVESGRSPIEQLIWCGDGKEHKH